MTGTMKQKQLEIKLSGLSGFETPDVTKEQYQTPAPLAASLLHFAYMRGDLAETVYDLGCGTGILGIGAKLLGCTHAVGFDIDMAALHTAKSNAASKQVVMDFVCCDIDYVGGRVHTVVMNPPFGAQKNQKQSDRGFLTKALEVADVIYSIHNSNSYDFIQRFISPAVITDCYETDMELKRTFKFHKKDVDYTKVEIYRIVNNQ